MDDFLVDHYQPRPESAFQYYYQNRPTHYRCSKGQRIALNWYAPDCCGWVPPRPTERFIKEDEADYSRKERIYRKRACGHHMRNTYLAMDCRSLEWTTCGGWVLGPPHGANIDSKIDGFYSRLPKRKRKQAYQRQKRHALKAAAKAEQKRIDEQIAFEFANGHVRAAITCS